MGNVFTTSTEHAPTPSHVLHDIADTVKKNVERDLTEKQTFLS